jgi:hypothetical protein
MLLVKGNVHPILSVFATTGGGGLGGSAAHPINKGVAKSTAIKMANNTTLFTSNSS